MFDGYNSIDVLYFFPLTLPRLLPYWTVYMVTRRVSYKRKNCLPFVSTLVHPRNVGGVRVAHLFSCLCCSMICLYILNSVLWCPLRCPHKTMLFGFSFLPLVCRSVHVLLTLFVFVCRSAHVLFTLFVFVCRRAHVLFTLLVFVCRSAHVLFTLFVFVCRSAHVLFTLFVFVCRSAHVLFTLFVFVYT